MIDDTLGLPDGRRLGYAEYGAPDGMPVLYFHGAPGSRRSIFADMDRAAAQRGLRLIAPERPGYGLSDPANRRTVKDWTADMRVLTRALGIDRFRLIGFSMGSVYALACAQAIPARVERVAVVGGLAPLSVAGVDADRPESLRAFWDLARSDPRALHEAMAPLAGSPAGLVATMAASAAQVDKNLLAARAAQFEADYAETLRGGVEGVAGDLVLAAGDWAFPLAEVQARVDLWIGAEDRLAPPVMSLHLASTLPNAVLRELPDEGHFCLYTRWIEILDRLNH